MVKSLTFFFDMYEVESKNRTELTLLDVLNKVTWTVFVLCYSDAFDWWFVLDHVSDKRSYRCVSPASDTGQQQLTSEL